ncbi:MAG: DNA-binding protein [Cyanobacteria bacterium J06621_15]
MLVGTSEAACLLQICVQGVRRLLLEGRIVGAKKEGRCWEIPLFNGMPKIEEGSRGPKGTWRKRATETSTKICVNSHKIKSNKKNDKNEPVLRVQQGSKIDYCHEFEIFGRCRVIYRPNNPLGCGAQVWVEVEHDATVMPFIFADMSHAVALAAA